ncbi:MAG: hypothetical protein L0H94_10820, partial [Nitrospira sp.]|nr:hypothetical protein [Nitrospira sp.]
GVTNLAGSAATINLPDIENASFETIPFIEALRDPQKRFSVQDFLALCKQLGQIHIALTQATGISFEEEETGAVGEAVSQSLTPVEFLRALQALLKQQAPSMTSGHNVLPSLIEQIEGQVQAGVERVDPTAVQGYLVQMSDAEESFLKAIDHRMPEIVRTMSDLNMTRDEASSCRAILDTSLQDIAQLRAAAQQVNASSAMMFFTGLHSLLTVVAQRRVSLADPRVESVKGRLHAIGVAIHQWVEHGRAQRAAINQLVSAGHL